MDNPIRPITGRVRIGAEKRSVAHQIRASTPPSQAPERTQRRPEYWARRVGGGSESETRGE